LRRGLSGSPQRIWRLCTASPSPSGGPALAAARRLCSAQRECGPGHASVENGGWRYDGEPPEVGTLRMGGESTAVARISGDPLGAERATWSVSPVT
jgi:hypothetical protein